MNEEQVACVVGLGYVGLPLAVALAESGMRVLGLDIDAQRISSLNSGISGIEDIKDDRLQAALTTGLTVTVDVAAADVASTYVICVPTPLRGGLPDLTAVEGATRSVAAVLRRDDLVVLESTTYPGTTQEIVAPLLESGSGLRAGDDFRLAYSPERIDPGNPNYGIHNTPKVVGGIDGPSTAAATAFYERIVDTVVPVAGPREAEMAKLLENTFRHVNIALVNEMSIFCRQLDIDLLDVIEAAKTKPFGFMPFYPGPGVGGHCIPVDPAYLSWRVKKLGYSFRFVELAQEINASMPGFVVSRLTDLLNDVGLSMRGSKVLCLGVAYKAGIGDCRESPAIEVILKLRQRGAVVDYHDPFVPSVSVESRMLESVDLSEEIVRKYDAMLILTPHPQMGLDEVVSWSPLVMDTRGAISSPPPHVHRL